MHPFTGGAGPHDVRITTRYDESVFMDAVMGTVHEVGHALYEQGLNKEQDGLPVQRALSMGIHESQSLFWERYIGQSQEFWKAMLPEFHANFPETKDVSADDLYRFINKAKAGFIRVDADELTYSMHVVLRFELERALFGGKVSVAELPDLWRERCGSFSASFPRPTPSGCSRTCTGPTGASVISPRTPSAPCTRASFTPRRGRRLTASTSSSRRASSRPSATGSGKDSQRGIAVSLCGRAVRGGDRRSSGPEHIRRAPQQEVLGAVRRRGVMGVVNSRAR